MHLLRARMKSKPADKYPVWATTWVRSDQ